MNWSVGSMIIALAAVGAIWLFGTLAVRNKKICIADVQNLSIEHDVIKILIPLLTVVLAIFAYGASGATAKSQSELFREFLRMQTEMSEFRGEIRFRATFNKNWTLTLRKLDGEPFSLSELSLTPSFQISAAIGPETGAAVHFDPLSNYDDDGRTIVIENAHVQACKKEVSDECQRKLEQILIDFQFGGRPHRVVAYYKNK